MINCCQQMPYSGQYIGAGDAFPKHMSISCLKTPISAVLLVLDSTGSILDACLVAEANLVSMMFFLFNVAAAKQTDDTLSLYFHVLYQ